jgi:hypothetical protein
MNTIWLRTNAWCMSFIVHHDAMIFLKEVEE